MEAPILNSSIQEKRPSRTILLERCSHPVQLSFIETPVVAAAEVAGSGKPVRTRMRSTVRQHRQLWLPHHIWCAFSPKASTVPQ